MSYIIPNYGKTETKLLGKVKREQLYMPDSEEWLLRRISPCCENNCNNDYYYVNTSFRKLFVYLPIGKMEEVFRIICPNCRETIELEVEEYLLIEPFIKLNGLLEQGKIDEYEYNYRIDKINDKLSRMKRI
jgi:hypothetical protein